MRERKAYYTNESLLETGSLFTERTGLIRERRAY